MSEFKVGDIVYIKGFNECGAIKVVHENFIDKIVRYEVKTNNNEYTLLGRMLEPIDINLQHTQNLEQRIEKLEEQMKDCIKYSQLTPVPEEELKLGGYHTIKGTPDIKLCGTNEEPKPSLLTEDERVILRNLNKNWKWIARDKYGGLYTYNEKPKKKDIGWMNIIGNFCAIDFLLIDLFQFIKWEDDEPYNIEELLKGECRNEN